MRLFAALLPPERALDELAYAVEELRKRGDHPAPSGEGPLRWTARSNWHITLAFYGEVADDSLPALRERLARACARRAPLRLRIAGGGSFGRRALWAGVAVEEAARETGEEAVEEAAGDAVDEAPTKTGARNAGAWNADPLRTLAGSAAAAGRKAGVVREEPRHFRAHLTLARVRERAAAPGPDLRPYAEALDAFRGEPWTAGELVLMRSTLPGGGVPGEQPRYERWAAWPLGG